MSSSKSQASTRGAPAERRCAPPVPRPDGLGSCTTVTIPVRRHPARQRLTRLQIDLLPPRSAEAQALRSSIHSYSLDRPSEATPEETRASKSRVRRRLLARLQTLRPDA